MARTKQTARPSTSGKAPKKHAEDLSKLTVVQLKAKLKESGLDQTGLKAVLIKRLEEFRRKPSTKTSPAKSKPSKKKPVEVEEEEEEQEEEEPEEEEEEPEEEEEEPEEEEEEPEEEEEEAEEEEESEEEEEEEVYEDIPVSIGFTDLSDLLRSSGVKASHLNSLYHALLQRKEEEEAKKKKEELRKKKEELKKKKTEEPKKVEKEQSEKKPKKKEEKKVEKEVPEEEEEQHLKKKEDKKVKEDKKEVKEDKKIPVPVKDDKKKSTKEAMVARFDETVNAFVDPHKKYVIDYKTSSVFAKVVDGKIVPLQKEDVDSPALFRVRLWNELVPKPSLPSETDIKDLLEKNRAIRSKTEGPSEQGDEGKETVKDTPKPVKEEKSEGKKENLIDEVKKNLKEVVDEQPEITEEQFRQFHNAQHSVSNKEDAEELSAASDLSIETCRTIMSQFKMLTDRYPNVTAFKKIKKFEGKPATQGTSKPTGGKGIFGTKKEKKTLL